MEWDERIKNWNKFHRIGYYETFVQIEYSKRPPIWRNAIGTPSGKVLTLLDICRDLSRPLKFGNPTQIRALKAYQAYCAMKEYNGEEDELLRVDSTNDENYFLD